MDEQTPENTLPAAPAVVLPTAYSYGGFVQMRTAPATAAPSIDVEMPSSGTANDPE